MMYKVAINMSKVKQRLEANGVKIHLKTTVVVYVKADTPDDACANAIDKVCKEIKENKKIILCFVKKTAKNWQNLARIAKI